MEAHGDQSVAMIEIDRVAGEVLARGEGHDAVGRGEDDRARSRLEIGAAVRAARLAVEDPARAEATALRQYGEWRAERQIELARGRAGEDGGRLALFALDPRRLGGGRRDVLLRDAGERLGGVGIARDGERAAVGTGCVRRSTSSLPVASRSTGEVADAGDRREALPVGTRRCPRPASGRSSPANRDSVQADLAAGEEEARRASTPNSIVAGRPRSPRR
jgi:hypothetical protein